MLENKPQSSYHKHFQVVYSSRSPAVQLTCQQAIAIGY